MAANVADIAGRILKLIEPLTSDERTRVIHAALVLAGDASVLPAMSGAGATQHHDEKGSGNGSNTPSTQPKARIWMSQNNITQAQLDRVFNVHDGNTALIAAVPGDSKRKQTVNAYILAGLSRLLTTGEATFEDEVGRNFAKTAGCYDQANHSNALKRKGNAFSGDVKKGWSMSTPGLTTAAALVREIAGET